jgi:hypothetical protein
MAHPSFARSANENRIGCCFGRDHSAHHLISAVVKVCGCRPHDGGAAHTGAGVREPPKEETAGGVARSRVRRYGDLAAVVAECEYNFAIWHEFCEWVKTPFAAPVTSKSYALQKGHILQRYVPDGSLCTASAEQIFPRDRVQRNCLKFALYTPRDHGCISNRMGSGIRNCPRYRCRLATFGALPTSSMIDRAIIMLNDHRFWGNASGRPSSG